MSSTLRERLKGPPSTQVGGGYSVERAFCWVSECPYGQFQRATPYVLGSMGVAVPRS